MTKLPTLDVLTSTGSGKDVDVVGVFQDPTGKKASALKGPYGKVLEKFKKTQVFSGSPGSVQFIRFGGRGSAESVVLVGLGKPAELTDEKLRSFGGNVWAKLKAEKVRTCAVHLDSLMSAESSLRTARAFAEGLVLSCYEFNHHKTKAPNADDYSGPSKIGFLTSDKNLRAALKGELVYVSAALEAMNVTRDWSNEPSNIGTPEYYAEESKKLAKKYGITCKILTESDALKEKMGLFIGVGQGAEREGRIVVLDYNPKGAQKTICFVGKGVTFDSGGISIKPSLRMEDMKHDMTGAATIMGATLLAAKMKVPNRIITIMAFTENMPSGNAIQPGNILKARNGKTVEIINTDAEGRLILADILDYAQDFKPDAVVNAATLTGAISVALGKQCCGIFGNDEILIDQIRRIGDASGERIWQLPLFDEYFDDMKSDYADMKNSCNDSNGGAIRGAIFLKQYIRKGTRWAHLDIAATANGLTQYSYLPKRGANGTYVRTLAQFAAEF